MGFRGEHALTHKPIETPPPRGSLGSGLVGPQLGRPLAHLSTSAAIGATVVPFGIRLHFLIQLIPEFPLFAPRGVQGAARGWLAWLSMSGGEEINSKLPINVSHLISWGGGFSGKTWQR